MKVILLQDVAKVGKKDQVVNAKTGYARNYLIPNGLAIEATKNNMKNLEDRQEAQAEEAAYELAQAKAIAEELKEAKVEVFTKVGAGGKTFGAITNKEIAEALKNQHNIDIDRRKIVLPEKIKDLGVTEVTLKLHPDVHPILRVQVSAEE
ncbi:50S ribosomal protein L9 [Peptococcus simiae]|uniref:Large ribosomal subunit protein bL9 n=1 Tax=Peptococcus simiae TaxID=1643805 RepID=A0ABW9GXY7_9FIRM